MSTFLSSLASHVLASCEAIWMDLAPTHKVYFMLSSIWVLFCFFCALMNAIYTGMSSWRVKLIITLAQVAEFLVFAALSLGAAAIPVVIQRYWPISLAWDVVIFIAAFITVVIISFKWGNEVERRIRPLQWNMI